MQHWFSSTAEASKQVSLLRNAAYVDDLRAVARLARSSTGEERRAVLVEAADAKARIAIYGAKPAIYALARFEEAGAVLDNPTAFDRFVHFARAAGLSGASPDDLKLVLFGAAREPIRDIDQR